ncbi:hypothetical protein PENTCL1PPCAC_1021, partial [Pristionchus entomophagus]
STVLDEFDFKGQSTVTVEKLCHESCHIYASITPESKKLAPNLLIQIPKGFISVAELASRIDPESNIKSYLRINNTASLTIVNGNTRMDAGPVVVYIVTNKHGDDQVYEAEGLRRPVSDLFPDSVTVMSARPFTLKQARHEG